MLSFHNDPKIKKKYVDRVRMHIKMDNLIRGKGWDGSKGCAVGCTLEKYNHKAYETELGIPEWLARLEDGLFENMTEKKSRTWPKDFLSAIPVGKNLEPIKTEFSIMLLKNCFKYMRATRFDRSKNPDVVAALEQSSLAIKQMIMALKSGDAEKISAARSAAWSAAWSAESAARSAESAAWSAAWSAESAARSAESAAWSAESAARSAESAARSAAWSAARSAESAAWSAARSAESAAWSAARSAARSAESAAFDKYADELIKMLRKAKK